MAPRMTIALLHKVAKNEDFLKALYIGIVETLIYSNMFGLSKNCRRADDLLSA